MKNLQQDHNRIKPEEKEEQDQYLAGRGAQFNTKNRFLKNEIVKDHSECIDDWT
jgi:hypothetical protein